MFDPTKLATFLAASAQVNTDLTNLTPLENGLNPLQANVAAAQATLTTAEANEAAAETTLISDYALLVAAADALGIPRPALPTPPAA